MISGKLPFQICHNFWTYFGHCEISQKCEKIWHIPSDSQATRRSKKGYHSILQVFFPHCRCLKLWCFYYFNESGHLTSNKFWVFPGESKIGPKVMAYLKGVVSHLSWLKIHQTKRTTYDYHQPKGFQDKSTYTRYMG